MKGICFSDDCRPNKRSGKRGCGKRSDTGIVKIVKDTPYATEQEDWCPDCGHALMWINDKKVNLPEDLVDVDTSDEYYSYMNINVV